MRPDSFGDRLLLVLGRQAPGYRWQVASGGFWATVGAAMSRDDQGMLPTGRRQNRRPRPRRWGLRDLLPERTPRLVAVLTATAVLIITVPAILSVATVSSYSPSMGLELITATPDGRQPTSGAVGAPGYPQASVSPAAPRIEFVFTVINANEMSSTGVRFRNSAHVADTAPKGGLGVYLNERVALRCRAFGDAVGPGGDRLWYYVANLSRPTVGGKRNAGYLNDHYIDKRSNAKVLESVPDC